MKNNVKIILTFILFFTGVLITGPVGKVSAETVSGGHETRETAYLWGVYSDNKDLSVSLPVDEQELWIQFTVPSNERIYARCGYYSWNEGMTVSITNANGIPIPDAVANTPDDVLNLGEVGAFIALPCNNTTTSTATYYILIQRNANTNLINFSISLRNRIKSGRGTFDFIGTASNPGNTSLTSAGADSTELSLDLTDNTEIPPLAVVTSVSTSGRQSPSQGNVHQMVQAATSGSAWFTSTHTSATSGDYTISETNGFPAAQEWRFKYNAQATARSTMSNVTITLKWNYDLRNTNYETY